MMNEKRDQERHLTTEQLLDYIEQKLSSDEAKQVEGHLASDCSSCQTELAWLTETLNLMATDVWVDAPNRLQASVRQIFREQYSPKQSPKREGISISQWLQNLIAPRRPLVYAAMGLLLVVVVVGLLLQPWSGQPEDTSAEIAAYTGTVEVQSEGSDSWQAADSAEGVSAGDEVRTAADSSAVINYPDQSKTLMAPQTELSILSMSVDEALGEQVVILEQHLGSTQNYVQPLQTANSRFEIRTPAATVTVRGTSFSVDVEADGRTRVAVSEGVVQVAAQGMTVALEAGQSTEVESGSTPSAIESVPTVPIPTEFATQVSAPTPGSRNEPSGKVVATATPRPPRNSETESATATPTVVASPSPVAATETPTPTPKATSTPEPTQATQSQSTNTPQPTPTPVPPTSTPVPTATPVPPATATSEPPPPTPTEWIPPGQLRKTATPTPKPPPGQTTSQENSKNK